VTALAIARLQNAGQALLGLRLSVYQANMRRPNLHSRDETDQIRLVGMG